VQLALNCEEAEAMGSSPTWSKSSDLKKAVKSSQTKEARDDYEVQVNTYLQDLLTEYNRRDVGGIQRHLATISDALDKEIEGSVEMAFGGSVRKHTFVNGLSDIDMLVKLNNTSLADKSPGEVREYFAQRLRERLPGSNVKVGALAVTVKFSDGLDIQLLPALAAKAGVKISTPNGDGWSSVIKPDKFAQKLTQVNGEFNGRLVPVIKLFKGLSSTLPEDIQLKGYHIESLAIDAFEKYDRRLTYKDMLQHLCQYAATGVRQRIVETTGQSRYVDEYLGPDESEQRVLCSAAMDRISKRLASADTVLSADAWKDMMEP
jgi:hypothetical protein